MATSEYQAVSRSFLHTAPHLLEEIEKIDRLRQQLTDRFVLEHSLTAASVIELSRQLDVEINGFMKHFLIKRE